MRFAVENDPRLGLSVGPLNIQSMNVMCQGQVQSIPPVDNPQGHRFPGLGETRFKRNALGKKAHPEKPINKRLPGATQGGGMKPVIDRPPSVIQIQPGRLAEIIVACCSRPILVARMECVLQLNDEKWRVIGS